MTVPQGPYISVEYTIKLYSIQHTMLYCNNTHELGHMRSLPHNAHAAYTGCDYNMGTEEPFATVMAFI